MGTVTQTIGTSSRNFSTIALWEAALPASLVNDGNSYVGQCFNDTTFNLSTTATTIGGNTTDATHTILLTTGTGQGFRDNASAASNALRYNASNGVAVTGAVAYDYILKITDNFVTIQNLQFINTASNAHGTVTSTGTDFENDNCIIQASGGTTGTVGTLFLGALRATVTNSAVISDTSVACAGIYCAVTSGSLINNTVVRPSNLTTGGTGINCHYNTETIQNCVVAGFTTPISAGSATLSGSGNAIDGASYPTGLTGQVSLTIATEFVQPSNASSVMDWRLKSTSVKCKDNGTNSGAPTTDIIGQAIFNVTRDVGAWEFQGTAAAAPFAQTDWPNPRGVVNTVGWIDVYPNRSVAQRPFFSNTTFVVPRGPTATEPGFVDQSIWALVIPFAQTDWPNPVRRPVAPIEFHDSFSRPVTAPNPFRQTNWPNPYSVPVTIRSLGLVDGPIIGIDPFSQQDWPNPSRGPQWSIHGSTDQAIWAFPLPFSQTDWPNPVPRQPYVIGWTDNFPNRAPPGKPFAQSDWPNPHRAVVLPFWWTDSYNRTPVAIGNPFSQKDWPNPKGPTAIHAVGIIPYAAVLIPIPPPSPPSTEPDWKPFLVTMGKLMGMG